MYHVPPAGGNPGDPYVNKNPGTGQKGSRPTAEFFNQVLAELINLIEAAGLEPDSEDLTQLEQAIMAFAPTPKLLELGTPMASAATTDVGGGDSDYFKITGTTGITSFGSSTDYDHVWVEFEDACTITHHATDLILPGGANYTTEAGDILELIRIATDKWKCVSISKASPFASNAEAQAGTVTHKSVSPAALHAAFVKSAVTNGYLKLPGGIILQWGLNNAGSGTGQAVTFPIAFPNSCLNLSFGDYAASVGTEYYHAANGVTTSGFNFQSSHTSNEQAWWCAIGY